MRHRARYTLNVLQHAGAMSMPKVQECLARFYDRFHENVDDVKALEVWQEAYDWVRQLAPRAHLPSVVNTSWISLKLIGMLADLYECDAERFDKFWIAVNNSCLSHEVIPMIAWSLLSQNKLETAESFLFKYDDESYLQQSDPTVRTCYVMGLNNALNVLLDHYFATNQYFRAYDTVVSFNPSIGIYLLPRVAQKLKDTPRSILNDLFRLLLSRKSNLHSKHVVPFIRKVAAMSDAGELMVLNADRVIRKRHVFPPQLVSPESGELESEPSAAQQTKAINRALRGIPLFHRQVYTRIFRKLIQTRQLAHSELLLQEILISKAWDQATKDVLFDLLLLRAAFVEGMGMVSSVCETMIQKGVDPSKNTFLTLLAAMRTNKMTEKYFLTLKLVSKYNVPLDNAICTEYLRFLAINYPTPVLMDEYHKLFPSATKLSKRLGLLEPAMVLANRPSQNKLPSTYQLDASKIVTESNGSPCLAALNVIYAHLIHFSNDLSTVWNLYQSYREYLLDVSESGSPHTLFTTEVFVSNLSKKDTSEAIGLASKIFIDISSQMHRINPLRQLFHTKFIEHLIHKMVRGVRDGSGIRKVHTDLAVQVVQAAKNAGLPLTGKMVEPIVKYHLKSLNHEEASDLIRFALGHELLLSDSEIDTHPLTTQIKSEQQ